MTPGQRQMQAANAAIPRNCQGTTRAGERCQRPSRGPRCWVHGGRPAGYAATLRARWRARWQLIHAAPPALRATVAWQAAEACRLATARWRLALAWQARAAGDPVPWQAARDALIATLRRPGQPAEWSIHADRVASEV